MSLISELPISEKPIERLLKIGEKNLSNEELLAILLKTGTKNKSSKDLALNVLKEINKISDLKDISVNKLCNIKGIKEIKAVNIIAALELGRRVYLIDYSEIIKIRDSLDIYKYLKNELEHSKQEKFYCVYLDTKNKIISKKLLYKGTINSSSVHPREIFKEAFNNLASAFICVHNHPSGDSTPSKKDIEFTNTLVRISKLVGIQMLDHIIIGKDEYYSFFNRREK